MITSRKIGTSKGFSLVELLVVMVIMGLVITSVYSLFLNTKSTSATSEDVVDVQQNLRVAMETMVADIRMAGFLLPSGTDAIATAPGTFGMDTDADGTLDAGTVAFTLQTISSAKTYARVTGDETTGLVMEPDMAGAFRTGNLVHVIRPSTNVDVSGLLTVGAVADPPDHKLPINSYTQGSVAPDDMIIRKLAGESGTTTSVIYWLRKDTTEGSNIYDLVRDDGSTTGITQIASNINSLDLTYILEGGSEVDTTTDLNQIRAIRINMTAQTDENKTQKNSNIKTRSLQTVVKIQNAFGG